MVFRCHEARVFSWPWMSSQSLIPLWFLVCHLLLSPSSYRAMSTLRGLHTRSLPLNHPPEEATAMKHRVGSMMVTSTALVIQGMEVGLVKPHAQAGMVSFVFQAGGLTSLLHSLMSICFPGHCRGKKLVLPRAAKPVPAVTLGQGHRRFCRIGAGSCFGSSVKLGS